MDAAQRPARRSQLRHILTSGASQGHLHSGASTVPLTVLTQSAFAHGVGHSRVYRPLVGRAIVAALAAPVLKLQRHLRNGNTQSEQAGVRRDSVRSSKPLMLHAAHMTCTSHSQGGAGNALTQLAVGPSLAVVGVVLRPTYTCPKPPLPSFRSRTYSGEPPTWHCESMKILDATLHLHRLNANSAGVNLYLQIYILFRT